MTVLLAPFQVPELVPGLLEFIAPEGRGSHTVLGNGAVGVTEAVLWEAVAAVGVAESVTV